ncbi:MAG: O-antigen ligase family protein [Candidatus Eisenbacteria bacterium]
MSSALATPAVPPRSRSGAWVAATIIGLAVLVGLAAGDPNPLWLVPLAALTGAGVLYAGARWPFAGLLVMLCSNILLIVVRASGLRSVNLIDILMPPVLLVSVFGAARRDARANAPRGVGHEALDAAERAFVRSTLIFFGCAALSLFQLARLAGVAAALDSGLLLIRASQGLLLYPLCTWWLRTRRRIEHAWTALFVTGAILGVLNIIGVLAWNVQRAGMTLYLNNPDAPFSGPNEAGASTLIVAVVLLVRHQMNPARSNFVVGALMVALVALTGSRSGLLAWLTFGLLTLRWVKPSRVFAGALAIAALLPLIPGRFWGRLVRTVAVERGSFEAFSLFQRVYGWRAAWGIVQDHPWTGVGYLGYRFLSHRYNELRIVLLTVENYYYETLVSMGIVGLILLAVVIVRLFQLGHAVSRVAPPGSLAHYMAKFHTPLMLGLLVANMTGDNLVGMTSLAQLAMWTAVLVRSGHAAVAESGRS